MQKYRYPIRSTIYKTTGCTTPFEAYYMQARAVKIDGSGLALHLLAGEVSYGLQRPRAAKLPNEQGELQGSNVLEFLIPPSVQAVKTLEVTLPGIHWNGIVVPNKQDR